MQMDTFSLKALLSNLFWRPDAMKIITVTSILWCTWTARCRQIFQMEQMDGVKIRVQILLLAGELKNVLNANSQRQLKIQTRPHRKILKVDASIGPQFNGWGVFATSEGGGFLGAWADFTPTLPPYQAECLAILKALEIMQQQGWNDVIIESECAQAVLDLQNNAEPFFLVPEGKEIILAIQARLQGSKVDLVHITRDQNIIAHALAKYVLYHPCSLVAQDNQIPYCINETQLYNRKLGGNYTNAMNACDDLLEMTKESINASMAKTDLTVHGVIDDIRTWLSAAMTYQDTCLDGFTYNSTALTSNALSILTRFSKFFSSIGLRRRLLEASAYEMVDGFPSWLSVKDRELIASQGLRESAKIVVAADGTGTHTTIKAALEEVPARSVSRTVVYVKRGVYKEKIRVEKTMWNVLMIGDGAAFTVVTGNDNFVDGSTTFQSATFSAFGQGFIVMEMAFQNTAGASKHQAVAFLSDSDKSVHYKCKFDGYQDTLYPHTMRQFYRECDIVGTVDFIFGNAAVVLQNCNIMPRLPDPGQSDTLTAQGKIDENMNTGTSFHQCTVIPAGNLSGLKVYLGRPWKDYSTVVWMKTYLPAIIDPTGWMPWIKGVTPKSTIFYGEYANTGLGSSTVGRVKWAGVHPSLTVVEATRFTVHSFIDGGTWIPSSGVNFTLGL